VSHPPVGRDVGGWASTRSAQVVCAQLMLLLPLQVQHLRRPQLPSQEGQDAKEHMPAALGLQDAAVPMPAALGLLGAVMEVAAAATTVGRQGPQQRCPQ
jgi:hypothetical protein